MLALTNFLVLALGLSGIYLCLGILAALLEEASRRFGAVIVPERGPEGLRVDGGMD